MQGALVNYAFSPDQSQDLLTILQNQSGVLRGWGVGGGYRNTEEGAKTSGAQSAQSSIS